MIQHRMLRFWFCWEAAILCVDARTAGACEEALSAVLN